MGNDLFDGKDGATPATHGQPRAQPAAGNATDHLRESALYLVPLVLAHVWFISWPLRAGLSALVDPFVLAASSAANLYLSTVVVGLLSFAILYATKRWL